MNPLQKTQQQILRHHGGDGNLARERISATYEKRHDEAFWQVWNRYITPRLEPGDTLLDLGAGIGQFVQDLGQKYPQNTIVGIEVAPYMLEGVVDLPDNARMEIIDLNNPPLEAFAPDSVGAVMANMLVHEMLQPVKMIQAVKYWLKPGGRLMVIDLIRQPLQDYLQHRYPRAELCQNTTSQADLEDAFEHFLEHNRYTDQDMKFIWEICGFDLIEESLLPNGRMKR